MFSVSAPIHFEFNLGCWLKVLSLALFYSDSISPVFWFLLHWRNWKNLCPGRHRHPLIQSDVKRIPFEQSNHFGWKFGFFSLLMPSTTKRAPGNLCLTCARKQQQETPFNSQDWRGFPEGDWCIPLLDCSSSFPGVERMSRHLNPLLLLSHFFPKLPHESFLCSLIPLFPPQLAMRSIKLQVFLEWIFPSFWMHCQSTALLAHHSSMLLERLRFTLVTAPLPF